MREGSDVLGATTVIQCWLSVFDPKGKDELRDCEYEEDVLGNTSIAILQEEMTLPTKVMQRLTGYMR